MVKKILWIIVLFLVGYCWQLPRIATFDMSNTVKKFSRELASRQLEESSRSRLEQQFSICLEKTIKRYSHKHHTVLLVPSAVFSKVPDATIAIQQQLIKNMLSGKCQ